MATSTEQELNKDKWNREKRDLETVLDAIPFTRTQRENIDYHVSRMEDIFNQTNV